MSIKKVMHLNNSIDHLIAGLLQMGNVKTAKALQTQKNKIYRIKNKGAFMAWSLKTKRIFSTI